MRKKTFVRAAALVACFGILTLTLPTATAADTKDSNLKIFVKKQMERLTSLLPFLSKFFGTEKDTKAPDTKVNSTTNESNPKIKVTGGLSLIKPPKGGDKD